MASRDLFSGIPRLPGEGLTRAPSLRAPPASDERRSQSAALFRLLRELEKNDSALFGIPKNLSLRLSDALTDTALANVVVHTNPDPDALAAGVLILSNLGCANYRHAAQRYRQKIASWILL